MAKTKVLPFALTFSDFIYIKGKGSELRKSERQKSKSWSKIWKGSEHQKSIKASEHWKSIKGSEQPQLGTYGVLLMDTKTCGGLG